MQKRRCVTRFAAFVLAGLLAFGMPAEALAAGQPESVEKEGAAAIDGPGERETAENPDGPKEALEETAKGTPAGEPEELKETKEGTEPAESPEAAGNQDPEESKEAPEGTESAGDLETAENQNPEELKETSEGMEPARDPGVAENRNPKEPKETLEETEPAGDTKPAENSEEPEATGDMKDAENPEEPEGVLEETESDRETGAAENPEDTAEILLETVENTGLRKDLVEKSSNVEDFDYKVLDYNEKTIEVTEYKGSDMVVVIPEKINGYKVTSIGEGAFGNRGSLISIEIPEGVTSIGRSAFADCGNLASVEIPGSVTSIGDSAFSGCYKMTGVKILEGTVSIGDAAFFYCKNLVSVTIPGSVTSIGDSAFSGCGSLTGIRIPSSVTRLGNSAFSNCEKLSNIEIPGNVTSIGTFVFSDCSNLNRVEILEGVTSIGDSAFYECRNLTSVKIPGSVTSIGNSAFYRCGNLVSIEIPSSVVSIGDYAFQDCESLTDVEVPGSITSIGSEVFCNCNNLISVKILEGVTSIGNQAFKDCSSLTSVEIPKSVNSIGNGAFHWCRSLTRVVIPPGVTRIGDFTFSDCESLVNVEIPESVISIEYAAFSGCRSLVCVKIPEGVINIGDYAFSDCGSLIGVEIPKSVKSIGNGAFAENSGMIFYVESGSHAQIWAQNNGRTIVTGKMPEIKEISDLTISEMKDQCYTGAAVKPSVTIKDGEKILKNGTDYTVSYENNLKVGKATVTITGKGFYFGSRKETFTITAKNVSGLTASVARSQSYTGAAIAPAVTVKDGGKTLKKGTDYTLTYANNLKVGKATVTITGRGNYTGSKKVTFTITAKAVSGLTVSAVGSQFYTGKSITPAVTVKDGKKTLKKGTDYNVSYANNKKTGKATITVTGKGNYAGSKKVTFTILPNVSGVKAVSADYSSVKVSWKKVSGVTGYKVYRSDSKNGKYTCVKTIKGAGTVSYKDGKLTTGKTYYYKVRAYVSGQDGSLTSVVSAKPAMASASLSSVSNTGAKTATVKWKQVSGASGYEVYSATAKNGKYKKITTVKKTGTVSYKDTKLKKGSTYYYKVRAYRTVNGKKVYGGYSAVKNVKIKK